MPQSLESPHLETIINRLKHRQNLVVQDPVFIYPGNAGYALWPKINSNVAERVDIIVSPNRRRIDPKDIQELDKFLWSLVKTVKYDPEQPMLYFHRDERLYVERERWGERYIHQDRGVSWGMLTYIEKGIIDMVVRTRELTKMIVHDPKLLERARRNGFKLGDVYSQEQTLPLDREIRIRPLPFTRLAELMASYDRGRAAGVLEPNLHLDYLREGISPQDIRQIYFNNDPFENDHLREIPDGQLPSPESMTEDKKPAAEDIDEDSY